MVRACKYYFCLVPEVWRLATSLRGMWGTAAILIISGLLLFNQKIGEQAIKDYDGVSWAWGFVFIGASIIFAFLKVNFNKHSTLEDENTKLKNENDALKKINLDIEYSGLAPHRDTVLDVDRYCVTVRNKSETGDLKSVNLWLVNITSISGWNHNRSETLLRQNGDNPPENNPFRENAILTPGQPLDYEFLSRWRGQGAAIVLHYAISSAGSIPSDRQYRITLKATASNSRAVFCQFLVWIDEQNRLRVDAFPSYVKQPTFGSDQRKGVSR